MAFTFGILNHILQHIKQHGRTLNIQAINENREFDVLFKVEYNNYIVMFYLYLCHVPPKNLRFEKEKADNDFCQRTKAQGTDPT